MLENRPFSNSFLECKGPPIKGLIVKEDFGKSKQGNKKLPMPNSNTIFSISTTNSLQECLTPKLTKTNLLDKISNSPSKFNTDLNVLKEYSKSPKKENQNLKSILLNNILRNGGKG